MSKEDWQQNTLPTIFGDGFPNYIESVLDVACGIAFKSKYIKADIRVGVDIYEPYFAKIESDVPYITIKHDVRKLNEIFTPKSFDVVIATDIIEHLTKEEGLELLLQCEEIARVAVVVETPRGYVPQDIDILGYGGHEWQTHRSGWEVQELHDLGYSVRLRDYEMQPVKRHSTLEVPTSIQLIDAIKYV